MFQIMEEKIFIGKRGHISNVKNVGTRLETDGGWNYKNWICYKCGANFRGGEWYWEINASMICREVKYWIGETSLKRFKECQGKINDENRYDKLLNGNWSK